MKVLVLSFYFPPDLSAGSFRVTALVDTLAATLPKGSHLDVVTTLPNRYHTFSVDAPAFEERGPVTIQRIALPPHRSGMIDQSRAFYAFARGTMTRVAGRRFDLVYATSSRLMTAVLGAWIARRTRTKLFLDLRDIFADTMKEVLTGPAGFVVSNASSALERFAIRSASQVNLVSPGFLPYFTSRYPGTRFSCHTNGIDDEFVGSSVTEPTPSPRAAGQDTITVVYAGNIGEGQGLHLIVPQLARMLGQKVRFKIIGDGGRRDALADAVRADGLTNVEILPPMDRKTLLHAYVSADVLFLHLNRFEAFQKVLPSKIFEYAALGKPIWAGVSGFAAEFLAAEVSNCAVFPPCDAAAGVHALSILTLEDAPRTQFVHKYGRAAITLRLAADVASLGASAPGDAA